MHTQQLHGVVQVLEALALAEPPPEVEDNLKPDHEWMLSTANDELESFRVNSRESWELLAQNPYAPRVDAEHCK